MGAIPLNGSGLLIPGWRPSTSPRPRDSERSPRMWSKERFSSMRTTMCSMLSMGICGSPCNHGVPLVPISLPLRHNPRRMKRFAFALAVLAATTLPAAVQSPSQFLGFDIGADRNLADYRQIVSYFRALAAASPRVRVETLGKTTLGED